MVSLGQLNQHIDDVHQDNSSKSETTQERSNENERNERPENSKLIPVIKATTMEQPEPHTKEVDTTKKESSLRDGKQKGNESNQNGEGQSHEANQLHENNLKSPIRHGSPLSREKSQHNRTKSGNVQSGNYPTTPTSSKSTPARRTLSLDLLDNNRGFSLSNDARSPTPASSSASPRKRISRSHWKHPSTTNICSHSGCGQTLSVRNGIVNCRKCGRLFCNEHTDFRVRLSQGPQLPEYSFSQLGVWSRCCELCFYNKPDLVAGTEANSIDLTAQFRAKRAEKNEDRQLQRNKIVKRFIELVEKMVNLDSGYAKAILDRFVEQKTGPAIEWDDSPNCGICFVQFGLFLRKHHCRLCGQTVCDDPYGERKACSIMVPIGKLVEKLPNLNYTVVYSTAVETQTPFRCCVVCKNLLLHEWKKVTDEAEVSAVFGAYSALLAVKTQIVMLLERYEQLVRDKEDVQAGKHRVRLLKSIKDYEKLVMQFKGRFFERGSGVTVLQEFARETQVILNMYQAQIMFLQDNLEHFKAVDSEYEDRIAKMKASKNAEQTEEKKLTKKEIRELREQLMVMNEQKFLVEQMIQDKIRARKFEELEALAENKKELENIIEELEVKLGGFGF